MARRTLRLQFARAIVWIRQTAPAAVVIGIPLWCDALHARTSIVASCAKRCIFDLMYTLVNFSKQASVHTNTKHNTPTRALRELSDAIGATVVSEGAVGAVAERARVYLVCGVVRVDVCASAHVLRGRVAVL